MKTTPRSLLLILAAAGLVLVTQPGMSAEEAAFEASLAGSEVSGDPDGQGHATVTVSPENEIDVRLEYSNIAEPTSIHIREGKMGRDGNIVATFAIESEGNGTLVAEGTAKPESLQGILTSPEEYYLVVLNSEHVVGALRGPLRK